MGQRQRGEQGVSHLVFSARSLCSSSRCTSTNSPLTLTAGLSGSSTRSGLAFELDYDPAAFPSLFEWLHLRDGNYAVGLGRPPTDVAGDAAARADGTMTWLRHGEERHYQTMFRFTRAGARAG